MADTTPLGLKGLECAKLLLIHAKVSASLSAAARGGWPTDALAMIHGDESIPLFRGESQTHFSRSIVC